MTILLWTIVIFSFIAAFIGLVVPLLPGVLLMWIGFFVYQFGINNNELSWFFWLAMITLTTVTLVSDYVAGSYFVKKFGGSRAGEFAAAIGMLIGSFLFPPLGIIAVPFIVVLFVELYLQRDVAKAFNASVGSLLGFLTSTVAKFLILIIMIIWFVLDVVI
ncbi:DUF456 domain-containing protein [Macrococcus armenti]|uniref:DUF456 domain-containing protein n=1 Tax=Macrococcus armenti TaxID=2875764 RepID=UPI001CCF389B|nr:DUF456 domain-containing protein [Macrococcus armenti]UBH09093.1 DUF456 domain-containing protein [Macrococcus armenti]UBH11387.1 DUF456 domain-containing protein [Macrococcus armenti]